MVRSQERGEVPAVLFVRLADILESFFEGLHANPKIRFPCPVCIAAQLPKPTFFEKAAIEVLKLLCFSRLP